jgi:hypothetical protein
VCHEKVKYSQISELLICDVVSTDNCLPTYISYYLSFGSSSILLLERQISLTILYFNVVLLIIFLGDFTSAGNLVTSLLVFFSKHPCSCSILSFEGVGVYYMYMCVCVCGGPWVCIVMYFMASILYPIQLFIPYPQFGDLKS